MTFMTKPDEPNAADLTVYRAKGCPECDHAGYRGRLGLFELLSMDTTMRRVIVGASSMGTMRPSGSVSKG